MSEIAWPPPYDVGDLVDVIVRRARVVDLWDEDELPQIEVTTPGPGGEYQFTVHVDDPGVTVEVAERRRPAQWPPRRGDVWRDRDGFSWFVVEKTSAAQPAVDRYLTLVCCAAARVADPWGEPSEPGEVLRVYGPLELLHRDPPPAEQPAPVDTAPDDDTRGAVSYDMTDQLVPVDELLELYGGLVMPVHDRPAPEPVP